MKTSYVIGAVVLVIIIAGVWWYSSQQSTATTPAYQQSATQAPATTQPAPNTYAPSTQPTSQAPAATSPSAPSAAPVAPATPQSMSIAIKNFAFSPKQISVKTGTKVTWTNNDSAPHTVTSDNGAFDSGTINSGSMYSFVFKTPGTFSYHCTVHPSMTATIVVTQ